MSHTTNNTSFGMGIYMYFVSNGIIIESQDQATGNTKTEVFIKQSLALKRIKELLEENSIVT